MREIGDMDKGYRKAIIEGDTVAQKSIPIFGHFRKM